MGRWRSLLVAAVGTVLLTGCEEFIDAMLHCSEFDLRCSDGWVEGCRADFMGENPEWYSLKNCDDVEGANHCEEHPDAECSWSWGDSDEACCVKDAPAGALAGAPGVGDPAPRAREVMATVAPGVGGDVKGR
jgi:hypothetical protein